MSEREDERIAPPPEGLAGGPGPTPPGFDDGTPRPLEGAPARSPGDAASKREQLRPTTRGDPEEPDPS